jgi:hypothetical protein
VGFSEMNASLAARVYSVIRDSRTLIAAKTAGKLSVTVEKTWGELSFLNNDTDGGFFKLRQVVDKNDEKKASYYKYLNGQKVEDGWKSTIRTIVADTPDKLRGERVELIILEEAGSWNDLLKAYIQAESLINVAGKQIGSILFGGTGGDDRGSALIGLRDLYYAPKEHNILPFRHSFTSDGSEVLTGYFLPAFSLLWEAGYMDSRGWCDPEKARAYY